MDGLAKNVYCLALRKTLDLPVDTAGFAPRTLSIPPRLLCDLCQQNIGRFFAHAAYRRGLLLALLLCSGQTSYAVGDERNFRTETNVMVELTLTASRA
jgi:hypothetical protein